jgi:hypothetical protein
MTKLEYDTVNRFVGQVCMNCLYLLVHWMSGIMLKVR